MLSEPKAGSCLWGAFAADASRCRRCSSPSPPHVRSDGAGAARRQTSELASRLAAGKEPQLLRDYAGALLRLDAVTALRDAADGDAVFPFEVVRLQQTSLAAHSRLYYYDLSEGGPRAVSKAPRFRYPSSFRGVTGNSLFGLLRLGARPTRSLPGFHPRSRRLCGRGSATLAQAVTQSSSGA